ncbi:MAG: hypothetical protein AB3A66_24150 [Nodularia sp. CChRGM 3473]
MILLQLERHNQSTDSGYVFVTLSRQMELMSQWIIIFIYDYYMNQKLLIICVAQFFPKKAIVCFPNS